MLELREKEWDNKHLLQFYGWVKQGVVTEYYQVRPFFSKCVANRSKK